MKKIRDLKLSRSTRYIILSAGVSIGGILLVWAIFLVHLKVQKENLCKNTALTGKLMVQNIISSIKGDIQRLENLRDRIEITNGDYFKYWSHDASLLLNQKPSFIFVEWIDSNMIIRKIEPEKGNESAVNLDISKLHYRKGDWLRHTLDASINITPWTELTQGGKAFLVDVPVYYNNRFQGTITGGMDFSEEFNAIMHNSNDFGVQVLDQNGQVFYQFNVPETGEIPEEFLYSQVLNIGELISNDKTEWKLSFFPLPDFADNYGRSSGLPGVIMGVLVSILAGITVYYAQRASGEARRVHSVNRKLKKLNRELNEERRKAEKASQTKTEFLANMSHEIRTPLNAILGFIEVLKNMETTNEKRKYLDIMDFSSKNLLSLVDDILEIDKIESGSLTLREEVFSPQQEINNLVKVFSMGFAEKGLSLDYHCSCTNTRQAWGDIGKFNQIITNLLRNSFKFTHEGGVEVNCMEEVQGDKLHVEVRIKDTGIGIPEDKINTIFDRFAQVDSSLRRKHEGSGLGLAITYQLVHKMGGSITVHSKTGKGSEFLVKLPLRLARENTEKRIPKGADSTSFEGKKILIVEDNAMNVMVLQKVLEQFGIDTDVADNGMVALDKTEEQEYDLIFMDIHMPEMDGFEATRIIRKRDKDVVIVGLSANVTREAIDEAREVGMRDYLTKPFSRDKLLALLNRFLSNGYKNQ